MQAGSDLILANSFGGTSFCLKLHNAQDLTRALNIVAAKLARGAVVTHFSTTGKKAIVAGLIGPTGELFEPLVNLTHPSARAGFFEQAQALAEGGVDVLWIKTVSSNKEVVASIATAKATGLPICTTMTFNTTRRSMMGVMPADFAEFVQGLGANFVDSNCGIPAYVEGAIHYLGTSGLMAAYALLARDSGAKVIGGCCAQ